MSRILRDTAGGTPALPFDEADSSSLRILSYIGKVSGFVAALGSIPFVDPKLGIVIFAGASILKDRQAVRSI